jgi:hypothetical protein
MAGNRPPGAPFHKKPFLRKRHIVTPAVLVMGLGSAPNPVWETDMSEQKDQEDTDKPNTKAKQPEKKDNPEGAGDQQGHQREEGYDEA